jgi:hypothetical protein
MVADSQKIYYKPLFYLFRFVFFIPCIYLLLFEDLQVWMLQFMNSFPGSIIRYLICAWVFVVLVRSLPFLIYAIFRIPAVEFRGNTLITRSWYWKELDWTRERIFYYFNRARTQLWIYTDISSKSWVEIAHIDGPKTLVDALKRVAEEQTEK